MLIDPHLENVLPKTQNRYSLALLVAKRTRQLVDGAQPLSERRSDNCITQASMELEEDKLALVRGEHEFIVPLRPEVEAEHMEEQRQALEKEQEALLEEAKLADSKLPTPDEREALERQKAALLQDQNAREFTAQLLEIIGRQQDESEDN